MKYELPSVFIKLRQIEEDLEKSGHCLLDLHLTFADPDFQCSITPPDLITFFETRGDLVHFGYLTDFGAVKDLEEAFVVCVSPAGYPPLKVVARNISDFLALVVKTKNAESLDYFTLESESFEENEDKGAHYVALELSANLTLPYINDVRGYIRGVQDYRESLLRYRTSDGLGIRRTSLSTTNVTEDYVCDFGVDDIDRMKEYLSDASYDQKLAFVREANYRFVLARGFREEIQILVARVLSELGLEYESQRMHER